MKYQTTIKEKKTHNDNLILLTDSYKVSHAKQYPTGTQEVYSYFESRGGEFPSTVFFGLQYYLKRYLQKGMTQNDIFEAKDYFDKHLGPGLFYEEGWHELLKKHKGKLPIEIKAVPEGSVVPTSNVLMTIRNTDPDFWWLTNYLETLLVQVWYPSTVATISKQMKKYILESLEKTGDPSSIDFKLHDFGCRGVETMESAMVGGMGHLVNFLGTDTIPALIGAKEYYGCDMAGYSIPASEHSTITSWGKEGEVEAFRNMLTQYPEGLVACVSDSWDIYNACENLWGTELKDKIINRNGTLVLRPDSGNPEKVLPKILNILWDKFGGTRNEKGYRVLDSHIRVIQGDGIKRDTLPTILNAVNNAKFSTDNLAFGSGGGLLQDCNRDTSRYAFKCSSIIINGEQKDVYKEPIEDTWKKSKKGKLKLIKDENSNYKTVSDNEQGTDVLQTVFLNGDILVEQNFNDIRNKTKEQ